MAKKTKEELAQARRRRETERIAREKQERLEHENKLKDYKERVNKFLASV
ncbi:MAG: hypothetical protein HY089_12900, partial [Ignavibacteriales bacterium]|nr:hypothetical protein [Ignavibacteriales bacterium]